MVACGHLTQASFSSGTKDLTNQAVAAVAIFFVLSGFMIRYITRTRVRHARTYIVDRASRIYSVVIPALLLTIVLDAISYRINPAYYLHYWGGTSDHPIVRVALNLTFLSQAWFHSVSPLSNSPFWSLGYECLYYAVYGVAFYSSGRAKWFGLILIFLLIGPIVFLLFPIWLLGAVAYDVFAEGKLTSNGAIRMTTMVLLALTGVLGTGWAIQRLHLLAAHRLLTGRVNILIDGVGVIFGAVLPACCWGVQRLHFDEKQWFVVAIRQLANSTFTLYLMHFPLLVLVGAAIPYNHGSWPARIAILCGLVAFSVAITPSLDRLKKFMRKTLLPQRAELRGLQTQPS